ncbi:hypothetical protein GCM10012290_00140 [Halolactibacillus alkaliphilus]|uniref:SIS domain-containing protein n=1 Tax=Halolactibacillus alkaliphilus TaxID=442899 RepID=A0A511WYM8_9BACI|nr:SIS domain-containing protein [Halolactibacillus alkaliphilus]GEN55661.1 hypothetical protein HAL01_01250 [Halolactibacillus alkaliphilus]GGN63548.1 hypothetical protein GCM10012290_00140 [Halolactibacillus alkaliphilus]SFO62907.1 Uncharacterized protein, contains SIS (Sugar ISomerase) phosphosugar binding domain [Halolactibacillus alkaliphilus]
MYEYVQEIKQLLDKVEANHQKIDQVVDLLIDAGINQQSIFCFGAGHAGIIAQEMYYRAGGLMIANPIFSKELMLDIEPVTHTTAIERLHGYGNILANETPFEKGDVLIVHSVSGRNPAPIELAIGAKEKGVTVVAITSVTYTNHVTSRHQSGKKLKDVADVVLDNFGSIGDGAIKVEGTDQYVAPTSTVIGATIVNILVSEMVKKWPKDQILPVFYSANLDGGMAHNKAAIQVYQDQIHYRFD